MKLCGRLAKCHRYEGYIRLKELVGWGKKFGGEDKILQNQAIFGKICTTDVTLLISNVMWQ